ncbi:MAG TPA: hypothetical protein VKY89_06725 [Thermoanaerobaculia bacterium]|nr:hypothetical protein [Thermoanaerobaculia bacterium]
MVEHRPLVHGALRQQRDLVAALGESQEEREEGGAQEQPARDLDAGGRGAAQHPQHEEERDAHDVEDDHVLEPERVEQVQEEISCEHSREAGPEPDGQTRGGGGQHQRGGHRRRHREGAGGQGTQALERMVPVLLAIAQVVDQIDGGGRAAEGQQGEQRPGDRGGVAEPAAEDEGRQHEEVLRPLGGPERADQGSEHARYCTGIRGKR